MVRRTIKLKRIENATTRQVTFSKRRSGLLKKKHDLSVPCDAEVGVIILSGKGKVFQFANPSMDRVLERETKCRSDSDPSPAPDNNSMSYNSEADRLTQFTEKMKALESNLIGDDLERLSLRDLIHLEHQIQDSLGYIRAKKEEILLEQLEEIKETVSELRTSANLNSSFLAKLVESGPSEFAGSRNSSNGEASVMADASLHLW